MKFDKQELEKKIRDAKDLSNEDKSNLLGLLNEKKTYGLVWEDSTEDAFEQLKTQLPILREVEDRQIVNDTVSEHYPNHILIEGENLQALVALTYTHGGMIDAIYIDPPYNSGARDWKYNNDYVDGNDAYRHSKWISMIYHRLLIARKLLNPFNSILIVAIDEKEYLHLGCLLESLFPYAKIQMVSTVINPAGVARENQFSRSDEYLFFVQIGECAPQPLPLGDEWFVKADKQFKTLYWRSLSRAGSNDTRKHSPGCFYPIFVYQDGSKIHSVGDALPLEQDRNSVIAPEGTIAIWPLHMDGSEGCWMQAPKNLKSLIQKGYVHLGNFTERGMAIKYLNKKEIEKVENGLFEILGNREDGSIITDENDAIRDVLPTTQWCIPSHNARSGGTELLKSILGPKAFPFPKSLYAVHDSLMFYVKRNKSATILDFFAGSGTTMHATMQLNAEDGGNRQCILVTNNENNICEDVTYERDKRVIEGYTTQNGNHVEGLKANNLRYYKVDFKGRKQSHQSNRDLAMNLKDLLCIKEDIYTEQKQFGALSLSGKEQMLRYFAEDGRGMLMVYDTRVIPFITKEIEKMDLKEQPLKIYVFTDGAYPYIDDFASVIDKVSLIPMPYAYHRAIKDVLPEEETTKVDDTELTSEEQKEMMAEAIEAENNEKKED